MPLPVNPTRKDIDNFVVNYHNIGALKSIVREIYAKEGAGALLHPCEEYLLRLQLPITLTLPQ
jgi:hypothetical protein